MCTGAEVAIIASMASSAGGAYVNSRNAAKNQQSKINARNEQMALERERQKAFQGQNDIALNKALEQFTPDQQASNFGDLIAKREAEYAANAPAPQAFEGGTSDTPSVVKVDLAKRTADRMAKSKDQAKALARLGGTTDAFLNQGIGLNEASGLIGTTNNLARGSLSTNQLEQVAAANNVGNGGSFLGDALGMAGQVGMLYGASNGGFGSLFSKGGPSVVGAGGKQVANPGMWGAGRLSPAGVPYDTATYATAPLNAF